MWPGASDPNSGGMSVQLLMVSLWLRGIGTGVLNIASYQRGPCGSIRMASSLLSIREKYLAQQHMVTCCFFTRNCPLLSSCLPTLTPMHTLPHTQSPTYTLTLTLTCLHHAPFHSFSRLSRLLLPRLLCQIMSNTLCSLLLLISSYL